MGFTEGEIRDYKERKEIAKRIVNVLADMGMKYSEASSILRMAQEELGSRRSDEIVSKKTPPTGDVQTIPVNFRKTLDNTHCIV